MGKAQGRVRIPSPLLAATLFLTGAAAAQEKSPEPCRGSLPDPPGGLEGLP